MFAMKTWIHTAALVLGLVLLAVAPPPARAQITRNGGGLDSPRGNTAVLTTSGDITLTLASARYQILTLDADRDVYLPPAGLYVGDCYTVHVTAGIYVCSLKLSDTTTLVVDLIGNTTATVLWDGTAWRLL
ncbi:MAG: hypothetical protein D6692_14675 [Planctomycetota bacterium]|nr:MAG: hypothetical protein D6692_14675 [Planctomycetota bacterium]